ncbi:MAG: SDR family oxidoreductase [Sphingobacteriales bacterium]
MVVSILGCGWYGKAVAVTLIARGISVKGSATSPDKVAPLFSLGILPYVVQFDADNQTFDPAFFECDVLIISIPPKFSEGDEYLPKLQRIIQTIPQSQVEKVIYISSTGVYGDYNGEVNELDDPQPNTPSGEILLQAEKLFQAETAFKTTIIRFGGLVGTGRDPGRFFAGKTAIPNGLAPVNLVHLADCIGITGAIINHDAFGYLFNACSPHHPRKADFYREASSGSELPLPEFIDELDSWKLVNSINSARILNYQFKSSLLDN